MFRCHSGNHVCGFRIRRIFVQTLWLADDTLLYYYQITYIKYEKLL